MKHRVVLLFGSFNPPTNAHMSMAIKAHEFYPDADIIFVPAHSNYLRDSKGVRRTFSATCIDRAELLQKACAPYMKVSRYEMNNEKASKTYDTLRSFDGYAEKILALGADNIEELTTWYRWAELVRENKFLVFSRNGHKLLPKALVPYKDNFRCVTNDYPDVSSTKVRYACKFRDYAYVFKACPYPVYRYLFEHADYFE